LNTTLFESGYAVLMILLFASLRFATYLTTFEESSDVKASIVMLPVSAFSFCKDFKLEDRAGERFP